MTIDVRTEDGNVTSINNAIVSGTSFNAAGVAHLAPVTVDTLAAPPPGQSATYEMTIVGNDAVAPAAVGQVWTIVVRKSGGGVLTIAASNATQAALGDAALVAALTTTFGVSANNTLTVTYTLAAYANPVSFLGVLQTGATT
jgi:hypothetical protein